MGNKSQKIKINTGEKIVNKIDNYARDFILKSSYQNLIDLQDVSNCSKLTVIAKNLLKKNLTPKQILYLNYRIKDGRLANLLTRGDFNFIDSEIIDRLNISNNVKKDKICLNIANFYVSFFHLFASIVKVINPIYRYKTQDGNTVEFDLLENKTNKKLDKFKKYKKPSNLCSERINVLKTFQNDKNKKNLEILYFDKYDYNPFSKSVNTYCEMSKKMKNIYLEDVRNFYKSFTGKKDVPKHIKTFSSIDSINISDIDLSSKDSSSNDGINFENYGKLLRNMIESTKLNQEKLVDILDEMFDLDENEKIIIKKNLSEEHLKDLIKKSREFITDIYVNCENDYTKAIHLFEAIKKKKEIECEKSKIEQHKLMESKILNQEQINMDSLNPISMKIIDA